ncbi:MAG: hypothetical protein AAGF33_16860, partial [Pseudomonadota bacterium]
MAAIAIATCVAVIASRKALIRWKPAVITLGALGLLWPSPIAMYFGMDAYVINFALHISAFTLIAVLVGFVWGRVARQLAAPIFVLALTLLPPLAGAT